MKYIRFFVLLALLAFAFNSMADTRRVIINASTHGTTVYIDNENTFFISNDATGGFYSSGQDYYVTICDTVCASPNVMGLAVEKLEVSGADYIYIYDGPSPSSPLLFALNSDSNSRMLYRTIFASPSNTSHMLTVRFVTTTSSPAFTGFTLRATCEMPCEQMTPVIDTFYYRTVDGNVVDTCYVKDVPSFDTTFYADDGGVIHYDSIIRIDTNYHKGVNLCVGMGVIFNAHGEYTDDAGYYRYEDEDILFNWVLGTGDTISRMGATQLSYDGYRSIECYDVELTLVDPVHGCHSTAYSSVRVRIAQNPVKTIRRLPSTCSSDSLFMDVGYDGNSFLNLRHISFSKTESKTNNIKTFIPDGPNCPEDCYSAPVTFTEFPAGRKVREASDICSICLNYEHEFMGDYRLSIVCPTGQKAVLKFADSGHDTVPGEAPSGSHGGSGTYTGFPYGGGSHHSYDGGPGSYCDSLANMFGDGLEYCFSRNEKYFLVDGRTANAVAFCQPSQTYLGITNAYIDEVTNYVFQPIPAPYQNAGTTAPPASFQTKHPSDHANKLDYYTPYSDFTELIGCPLNGEWNMQVCDFWGSDNGWVFSWSLDICNLSAGSGCEYQVAIDSVIWGPDPRESDTNMGFYRGLSVHKVDSVSGYLLSPDTAGDFRVLLNIHDEFNCEWDTATHITIVWTPSPDLGPDTVLCGVNTMVLDATDRHTATENYSYIWEPYGDDTPTITTRTFVEGGQNYTAQVYNTHPTRKVCKNRDTIFVNTSPQPIPNFSANVYPFEGCEPFTLDLTNKSVNGEIYRWEFGDGTISTEKDPVHVYPAGEYDFKYYVSTNAGCIDSLIYQNLIKVFPSPDAAFSWDPVYPTVLHPSINLVNRTNPMIEENKYFWEIQYDKENPESVHTLTDKDPTFEWVTDGEDISGNYLVRLISRTDNIGPSGNIVYCADTAETTILLVNDFLQFPNVVTPNGDGINDKFIIKNLVDGLAYPINSLYIYNRWGACVFHKENIATEDDFWDPAVGNIPDGTYFYKFTAKGYIGNIERNGVIEVLR